MNDERDETDDELDENEIVVEDEPVRHVATEWAEVSALEHLSADDPDLLRALRSGGGPEAKYF